MLVVCCYVESQKEQVTCMLIDAAEDVSEK